MPADPHDHRLSASPVGPLWDVVLLRERGLRLAREQVAAAVPVRGVLQLGAGRPGWHARQGNPPLLAGLVRPDETCWAIAPLDEARVKAIRAEHMLIVGIEEFDLGRGRVTRYTQAWWCRLVLAGGWPAAPTAGALAPRKDFGKREPRPAKEAVPGG